MGWQYDYSLNTTRGASAGTAVSDLMSMMRAIPETGPGLRGRLLTVPYRHGEVGDVMKWSPGFDIPTEGDLRYTDKNGLVVHVNGGPGHVHENWLLWKQLVGNHRTQLWLGRNDPHAGLVEIPVDVFMSPVTTTPRHRVFTQFRSRWPFWSDETQRVNLPAAGFTLAGTAPVADLEMKIVGGTGVKVTHDQTGDYIQTTGATPAGGILVDVGARQVTYITGGASAEAVVEKSAPEWFQLDPGAVSFTVSDAAATVTVDLYEQYR